MIIGEIVETLIRVKDENKNELTRHQVDAINEACNLLDHRFNRFDEYYDLRNNHIVSIHWITDDIKRALIEDGYSPCDENVSIVNDYSGLEKHLEEKGIEAGWDVIHNVISETSDKLKPLEGDEEDV